MIAALLSLTSQPINKTQSIPKTVTAIQDGDKTNTDLQPAKQASKGNQDEDAKMDEKQTFDTTVDFQEKQPESAPNKSDTTTQQNTNSTETLEKVADTKADTDHHQDAQTE